MDISAVVADFGAYYIDEGQNRDRLIQMLDNTDNTTLNLFPLHRTDETKKRFALTSLTGDILQAFQKAWTPRGQFEAEPLDVDQFKMKVDMEEYPDELEGSWLQFKEWKATTEDRSKWPFVRWLMEIHMLPRLRTNLGTCSFWGVRVEPTVGVAGAALAAYNGIRYLLNAGITANQITELVLGAVPTLPLEVVDYFEEMGEMIPEPYRDMPLQFNTNKTIEMLYKQGFDLKYNVNYSQAVNNATLRYRPNISIKGHVSHAGSTKIWATLPENMVRMMGKSDNMSRFEAFQKDVRQVQITTHFWHGIGFKTGKLIWTNDVDLV